MALEAPTETPPTVELPNPVIQSDMEFSKSTFNEAMEAEKSKASEPETPTETPEAPREEPKPEIAPEPTETTEDKKEELKTEVPTASKSDLPEELLTGKPPEPKTDDALAAIDAMELPSSAKPKEVASFGKIKEYSKKVIEEKLARISELESKTSDTATKVEIEAAQERIKAAETKSREYEQTIERLAFTESPRFKQFLNDETATIDNAKSYLEGTEINPSIIEYAARVNGSQRIKILQEAGVDASLIAAVSPYLAQYDTIQRHKAGAMENWKVESQQYAEQVKMQQEAAMQQRRQSEDQVWTMTISELKDLVPLRKFDKNDSWNSRSDEILQKAKNVYNGENVDLKEVATKIVKGEAYDALDEVRVALTTKVKELSEENARLKSSKPGASNGQGAPKTSDANLSEEDRRKRDFNTALERVRG